MYVLSLSSQEDGQEVVYEEVGDEEDDYEDNVTSQQNGAISDKPKYENIESDDAYLSDGYNEVSEFLNGRDPEDSAALLSRGGEIGTPVSHWQEHRSVVPGPSEHGRSPSSDRKLSLDNQYVDIVSPVRSSSSMNEVHRESVDSDTPELDYENLPLGIGRGSSDNDSAAALTVESLPSRGGQGPPVASKPKKILTAPVPRGKSTSPKPPVKPKPHPSATPPRNPGSRSKSVESALQSSPARLQVVSGDGREKKTQQRPHLEEVVFPIPFANGNTVVARGDDSRMRSVTTPMSNDHTNERGSETEEEEVFYVNVSNDKYSGEDLYQNVTHRT